jgi:hypothetical protein
VERGETTPGFDNSDDAQMDFALFKGWFLKHTQDLGASIRHRNEFLNYNGRGVPIDEVLQKLQMLQQRCNQHVDNPQDHVTQQELWNKISKLLDTRTIELCLLDPDTMSHPRHRNIPSYEVIERHVRGYLRLEQRMVTDNPAAYGQRHPAPPRLHNMEAEQGDTQLNNIQPREVTLHTGQTKGDDFLFHWLQVASMRMLLR